MRSAPPNSVHAHRPLSRYPRPAKRILASRPTPKNAVFQPLPEFGEWQRIGHRPEGRRVTPTASVSLATRRAAPADLGGDRCDIRLAHRSARPIRARPRARSRCPGSAADRAIGISEVRFGTVSDADDIEAIPSVSCACGRSSMVEPQPSKLMVRVRFPSPALWSTRILRDVAQLGSASALGAEGRRFKSCHPDHISRSTSHYRPARASVGP